MRYVFKSDLDKIANKKGQILKDKNNVVLVKTADIYTVWNPSSGFTFKHTFCEQEALETFEKYANLK